MEVVLKDLSFFDYEANSDNIYTLTNKGRKGDLHKLVDKVCLRLQPGSVTALIGSPHESRALLELIGLRQRNGFIVGSIYHDNSLRKNGSCFRDIAYVKDFDSNFFGHLTVEAFLVWAAQLRLTLSEGECSARAREAAKLLNLEGHVHIIDLHKGERILLTVAAALVDNPTLICIESPIDGMEESYVRSVVQAFSHISHRQNTSTTIVYSALAPSPSSLQHTDHIALFFNTKLLYTSGEMFDYKNPHLGVVHNIHSSSFSDSKRKLALSEDDEAAADEAAKFRKVIAESRDLVCTIARDISRSGYGTSHFSSQFVSSDHRRSLVSREGSVLQLFGGGSGSKAESFLTGKRVDAIEQRIYKHLACIAALTEGFVDQKQEEDGADRYMHAYCSGFFSSPINHCCFLCPF